MIDGATKLTEVDYAIGAETAIGTPVNVRKVHFDAAGKLVTTVHALTYGWQKYPALLAPNILTPVVETRTHVNEILTQASATTWGPANATMRWAPLATYMAKRSTGPFDFVQPANNLDWQASSIILARSVFGVVAETQDVGGIVHSVVYDKHDRLPVATFVHASVERHEAGYCGFEPYEQSAPPNSSNGVLTNSADPEESGSWNDEVWQINGSPEQNAHTGIGALSGSPARIEPQCFAPRSKQTSYVVSAWVKPRIGGRGGQIGFGSQSKTITFVNADTWQFVELMTESPHENEKPFVSCDGTIDDFRFGPLDAPFNATVYDPQYHLVTAKLDSNEGVVRMVYDHLRRPLATLGPDGQVVSLHSERLSRQAQQPFNPRQPNEALTLLPRKGGQYYSAFADYARLSNNSGHADPIPQGTNKGLRFRLVPQVHSNPGDSSEFVLQCGGASIKGSIAWEASGSSGRLVLNWPVITDSNQSPVVTDGDGNGVGPPVNLQSESSFKIGADCTVLLWLIDRDVYCFIDGTLSARHALSSSAAGALSLQWMPTGNAALVDLVSFYDPIVSSSFSDGLGRVIQTQHLADRGAETIAEQTLHDGWGHAAVQTKPIPVSRGLAYQDDLVSSFDWNSGVMRGRVADYYGQAEERVADHSQTTIRIHICANWRNRVRSPGSSKAVVPVQSSLPVLPMPSDIRLLGPLRPVSC